MIWASERESYAQKGAFSLRFQFHIRISAKFCLGIKNLKNTMEEIHFTFFREFTKRDDMKIYHMSVMEDEEDVVFMYTVAPGPSSKSQGFNAAKLTDLPQIIINQGLKIAEKFEKEQVDLLKLAEILQ